MNLEINWLRNLRIIASIAVITVHVCAQGLLLFPPDTLSGWNTLLIINCLAHFAIPVFIMISGALILSKNPSNFWRRTKKIIYLIIFWSLVYILFNHFVYQTPISLRYIASSLLRGSAFYHLYYLYIAGGLYLATPLLQKIITNKKNTLILLSVTLLSPIIIISTMFFIAKKIIDPISSLLFVEYLGYYVLGYYLSTFTNKFFSKWVYSLLFIILGTAISYSTIKITHDLSYAFHYLSLGNFMTSVGVFTLIKNVFNRRAFFSLLSSRATLGIYLLHLIILIGLVKLTPLNGSFLHPLIGIPLTVLVVYVITWLLVVLLDKTPLKIVVN
ncbi:MAG: acyltransferase family protein [Candidatus Magasanikiibacteriota bacterium]